MVKKERELISKINSLGYSFYDLNSIHIQKSISLDIVNLILEFIPKLFEEHIGTGIVACLCLNKSKNTFDASVLMKLFENENFNAGAKSSIGFIIADAKTHDISKWLIKQMLDKHCVHEKAALIHALPKKAGFKTDLELIQFCKIIFDKYIIYDDLFKIFKKYATKEDIDFLQMKLLTVDKPVEKKILKLINLIQLKE